MPRTTITDGVRRRKTQEQNNNVVVSFHSPLDEGAASIRCCFWCVVVQYKIISELFMPITKFVCCCFGRCCYGASVSQGESVTILVATKSKTTIQHRDDACMDSNGWRTTETLEKKEAVIHIIECWIFMIIHPNQESFIAVDIIPPFRRY
jgi:hypothetical protein